jgi:hypothetical protein
MQQSQKHHAEKQSTGTELSILTSFMSTLDLAIVSQLEGSNFPSSLSTVQLIIIGRLASNCSNNAMSAQRFWPSVMKLGHLPINFNATATRSCLAVLYGHSYTSSSHPLWQAQLVANPPTASSNPIGKSWYTCCERISLKSRCLGHSGTMP